MKSIIVVFVVTVLFLVGMTKFTNDTNYNEAVRYQELSQYNEIIKSESSFVEDEEILFETIEIDVTFTGAVKNEKTVSIKAGSFLSQALIEVGGLTLEAVEEHSALAEAVPEGAVDDAVERMPV